MLRILLFLSGCCSETEVSEQPYYNFIPDPGKTGTTGIFCMNNRALKNPQARQVSGPESLHGS
jgi:hypothetical protein